MTYTEQQKEYDKQYQDAKNLLSEKKFLAAVHKMEEIPEDYDKIKEVKESIIEAGQLLINDYSKEKDNISIAIKKEIDKDDLKQAQELLEISIEKYGEQTELIDLKTMMEGNITQKSIEKACIDADTYVEGDNFQAALLAINDAIKKYGEKDKLIDKKDFVIKGYKEDIYTKADEKASNGLYNQAYEILRQAVNVIGRDIELENKLIEMKKADVFATINEDINSNEYEKALKYISDNNSIINNDPEVVAKEEEVRDKFIHYVITQGNALFNDGKYNEAIDYVSRYISILDNNEILKNKIQEYKDCKPSYLIEQPVVSKNKYIKIANASDIWGNTYKNALLLGNCGGRIQYQLNGQFKKLKFLLSLETKEAGEGSLPFRIYDPTVPEAWYNQIPIFEKTQKYSDRPENYEIDVTGLDFIEIQTYMGMYEYPYIIISDAILEK
ncbi:MAG: hypothetical protein PHX08_01295 [Lachnospiraceae bacterium]|nr:hypothetical protein [Lachnospiraceae bacterium]